MFAIHRARIARLACPVKWLTTVVALPPSHITAMSNLWHLPLACAPWSADLVRAASDEQVSRAILSVLGDTCIVNQEIFCIRYIFREKFLCQIIFLSEMLYSKNFSVIAVGCDSISCYSWMCFTRKIFAFCGSLENVLTAKISWYWNKCIWTNLRATGIGWHPLMEGVGNCVRGWTHARGPLLFPPLWVWWSR